MGAHNLVNYAQLIGEDDRFYGVGNAFCFMAGIWVRNLLLSVLINMGRDDSL